MSLTKTADGRFRSNFIVVSSLRLQKRVIPQTKLTSCKYTIYIGYFYAQLKSSRYAFVIIINININININREIYIAPYGRNFRSVHGVHGATMKYPLTIFANLKKLLKIMTQNFAQ